MRNRVASVAAATLVLLTAGALTGCTQPTAENACEPILDGGSLSDNVTLLSGFGTEPTVSIPNDITVPSAQMTRVDAAEDRTDQVTEGSVVSMNYALYDSSNGEVLEQSSDFTSGQGNDFIPVYNDPDQGSLPNGLFCSAPGDRVVVVFSPEESELISSSIGSPTGTSIVGVVDVHAVTPFNLSGKTRVLPTGFPGVVTNEDGRPGVVVAPGKAPNKNKVATRIKGSGVTVSEQDRVIANVLSVDWRGTLISNTWEGGAEMLGNAEQMLHPVREHLNGHSVGSQMVVLTPDDQGSATIHVVDILAAG